MTEEGFFAFLKKRRGILDGVCVTGGEPLLCPDTEAFIRDIKEQGYAVKLDTNGSFPEKLKHLVEEKLVDYVAMDIKSSPSGYAAAAGIDIDVDKIRASIELIKNSGIPHEFRTTVVAGIHTKEDIIEAARLVGDSPYFLQSFVDSGDLIGGGEGNFGAFSPDEMHALCEAACSFAPLCQVRGVD